MQRKSRNILKNKKGNLEDIPVTLYIIFGTVLGVMIALIIIDQFNTSFQTMTVAENSTEALAAVGKINNTAFVAWDYAFPLILLGFILFSLVSARFIPTSPIYVVVCILFMIFIPLMAMIMGNVYDEMVIKNTLIAGFDTKMPLTAYIMDHLLMISLIYSALVAIVLYSRKGTESAG